MIFTIEIVNSITAETIRKGVKHKQPIMNEIRRAAVISLLIFFIRIIFLSINISFLPILFIKKNVLEKNSNAIIPHE